MAKKRTGGYRVYTFKATEKDPLGVAKHRAKRLASR